MSYGVIVLIGIVLAIAFGVVTMTLLTQDRPNVIAGTISGILAALSLIGGFYLADQQFRNQCEALGNHVIGDTCTSSYYVEIEDD